MVHIRIFPRVKILDGKGTRWKIGYKLMFSQGTTLGVYITKCAINECILKRLYGQTIIITNTKTVLPKAGMLMQSSLDNWRYVLPRTYTLVYN